MSKHDKLCHQGKRGQYWDMRCSCDYIAKIRHNQNKRIANLLKIKNQCPNKGDCNDQRCKTIWTAIAVIKEELK